MTDGPDAARIRAVVVDDAVLIREGLSRVLLEAGIDVVGQHADATSFLATLPDGAPDVVVMDVRMPPTFTDEGVRAAVETRRLAPGTGVLLLSQYVEATYAEDVLASGTAGIGYLLKDRVTRLEEIDDAVRRIAAGGTVLDPEVVTQLMTRRRDPLAALTPRERDVLGLMAEGRTNVAIARALVIGTGAVEKHVSSIFAKLGLEDTGEDHRRVLAVLAYLG
ncbi:response regulator transcription factor [Curtobacterium sp. VKM Ac-1395]|uniref:response regulator transcription factor n=1 Tax=Curtobacterium sp. VKM Ac-1395 TaxID=2783815 RepID=UPI00188C1D01|nr:response regulator transcription factor [Curtobacterium sp. VKM Ac-1395]MBF4590013.1 response regulator transcription factor [Curtobacterium sp. VKM Ac-1395]